ncbi:MAG: hypothetical protein ABI165_18710, partial [Bryobacteraceae bacterium]
FEQRDPFWVVMFSLILATMLFHCMLPQPPERRYMLAAIAPLLVFLPEAIQRLAGVLPRPREARGIKVGALFAVLMVTLGFTTFALPNRAPLGYREAAEWLYSQADFASPGTRVLVISDASGEGALISEIASRDKHLQHFALRSSKVLFASDWMMNHYQLLFDNTRQELDYLERLGIRYIILDRTHPLGGRPNIVRPDYRQVSGVNYFYRSTTTISTDDDNYNLADRSLILYTDSDRGRG